MPVNQEAFNTIVTVLSQAFAAPKACEMFSHRDVKHTVETLLEYFPDTNYRIAPRVTTDKMFTWLLGPKKDQEAFGNLRSTIEVITLANAFEILFRLDKEAGEARAKLLPVRWYVRAARLTPNPPMLASLAEIPIGALLEKFERLSIYKPIADNNEVIFETTDRASIPNILVFLKECARDITHKLPSDAEFASEEEKTAFIEDQVAKIVHSNVQDGDFPPKADEMSNGLQVNDPEWFIRLGPPQKNLMGDDRFPIAQIPHGLDFAKYTNLAIYKSLGVDGTDLMIELNGSDVSMNVKLLKELVDNVHSQTQRPGLVLPGTEVERLKSVESFVMDQLFKDKAEGKWPHKRPQAVVHDKPWKFVLRAQDDQVLVEEWFETLPDLLGRFMVDNKTVKRPDGKQVSPFKVSLAELPRGGNFTFLYFGEKVLRGDFQAAKFQVMLSRINTQYGTWYGNLVNTGKYQGQDLTPTMDGRMKVWLQTPSGPFKEWLASDVTLQVGGVETYYLDLGEFLHVHSAVDVEVSQEQFPRPKADIHPHASDHEWYFYFKGTALAHGKLSPYKFRMMVSQWAHHFLRYEVNTLEIKALQEKGTLELIISDGQDEITAVPDYRPGKSL